jgi:hypothetical protein
MAARNGWAGWMTCENCSGHGASRIASSLRAIGSLAATRSRSSVRIGFSTAEFTPNSARVVATSAFSSLRRLLSASSSEKPIHLRWNALSSTRWQTTARRAELTTHDRLLRQRRGDAERAQRKSPASVPDCRRSWPFRANRALRP